MAKILIVDDDNSQCMRLGLTCSSRGHAVEMTTRATVAIEKGLRYRPDVLICDWMLGGSLDGIDVAEVIRGVHPQMHAILVTAHGGRDVRDAALQAKMFGFFEKPLDHDKIFAAVDKASEIPPMPAAVTVGCLEFDEEGRILHINKHAHELLGEDKPQKDIRLSDVFSYRSIVFIENASTDWLSLTRVKDSKSKLTGFVVRGGIGASGVLLLLDRMTSDLEKSKTLRTLTDTTKPTDTNSAGSILIVDSDNLQRNLASTQLRMAGCKYYTAESNERAIKTLEADPGLDVVIIDYGLEARGPAETIRRMREISPDVRIIGTSAAYRKAEFKKLGVEKFLLKPVLASALSKLLLVEQ